ncbi:MAG: proprotein convertase P-domain-containing protein [Pseudomonadota bacterium]
MTRLLRFGFFFPAVGLAVLLLTGCDGGNEIEEDGDADMDGYGEGDADGETECPDVENPCTNEGDTRCVGTKIEQCESDAEGCLGWVEVEDCADGDKGCFDTGSGAECVEDCTDECDEEGGTQCEDTILQLCGYNGSDCLHWTDEQNCADDGLVCVVSDEGEAACEPSCTIDCETLDETRCEGTVIQRCTEVEEDCLMWVDVRDCADDGGLCDDSGPSPMCVAACSDDCDSNGLMRCFANILQTCAVGSAGCLVWEETENCTDSGMICKETGALAECACPEPCTDGRMRCVDTLIRTCVLLEESGCLVFVDGADCADEGRICVEGGDGTAECECPDPCTAGEARCDATVVQTCVLFEESGCFAFEDGEDCSDDDKACEEGGDGSAACICPDACIEGLTRCEGTMIQTCVPEDETGCTVFKDTRDCNDDELFCDDSSEPAICTEGLGESCDDAAVIASTPYVREGDDFTVDFSDDLELGGAGCMTRTGTVEAVFAVDLMAGETAAVRELGTLDVVVSFQGECGDTFDCSLSQDYGETDGFRHTATSDGERLFIIVEAYFSSPSSVQYEIHVDILEAEDCGDGEDNDLDGDVDCADEDCFGDETYCSTEEICDDGHDNDADGPADCDDPDCSDEPECVPFRGYWEQFGVGDVVDVVGYSITFTPDAGDENLYTWEYADGVTDFPISPGGGDVTSRLALDDDDSIEYTFSVVSSFAFFEADYTSLFVGSNGFVTFGAGDDWADSSTSTYFDFARIAGVDVDLDPNGGSDGAVIVDEYADPGLVAVTFNGVPRYTTSELNSFQVVMNAGTGVIELHYVELQTTDRGMIGLSNGAGNDVFPGETDFVPAPPPVFAVINEVACRNYEEDDAEFVEIVSEPGRGFEGFALVHYDGATGGVVWAVDLPYALIPDSGILVIGDAGVDGLYADWADLGVTDADALGNGADALVLYTGWDGESGTVFDAVGWGDGAAVFRGEGGPAPAIEDHWNNSIGRYPDGTDTDSNADDFVQSWWPTPGEANTQAQPDGDAFVRLTASSLGGTALPLAIPDNTPAGVSATVTSADWLPASINDIHVGVKIRHTYIGDLIVDLTSPAGTTLALHDRTGSGTDNIFTVYDLVTAPDGGSMAGFDGEATSPGSGTWTLHVSDNAGVDTGRVEEWIVWVSP